MFPPPPTSTLFPYTTLFRSPRAALPTAGGFQVREARPRIPSESGRRRSSCHSPRRPSRERCREGRRGEWHEDRRRPDRKSTRLNSSHANISYAVFCLKKKK